MITKKKVLTGIAGVLLVAATAGYGAAAYYYSSHFYSHTEINGIDYGEMTVAQVKKKNCGSDTVLSDYNRRKKRAGRNTDRRTAKTDLPG